jgi:hypothetical protein
VEVSVSVARFEAGAWTGSSAAARRGPTHDETAFKHLLELERRRSARTGRMLLLALVGLCDGPGSSGRIDPRTATAIFSAIRGSVRETDIVGWYRIDHVAGAVFAEVQAEARADVSRLLAGRIEESLRRGLPIDVAHGFHVQIVDGTEASEIAPRAARMVTLISGGI